MKTFGSDTHIEVCSREKRHTSVKIIHELLSHSVCYSSGEIMRLSFVYQVTPLNMVHPSKILFPVYEHLEPSVFVPTWPPTLPELNSTLKESKFHIFPVKLLKTHPESPAEASTSKVPDASVVPMEERGQISAFCLQKNRTRLRSSFHCPKIAMASPFQPLF